MKQDWPLTFRVKKKKSYNHGVMDRYVAQPYRRCTLQWMGQIQVLDGIKFQHKSLSSKLKQRVPDKHLIDDLKIWI